MTSVSSNDSSGLDGLNRQALERENREPSETPRGVPMLVAALTGAIGGWGATYLWYEAGDGTDARLGDGRAALIAAANSTAPGAEERAQVDGAGIYAARCSACHQGTGLGIAGAFPPLAKSRWVLGDPRRTAGIVLQGLQGEIEVQGKVYNGVMPAFREQLSDAELAAVLTYIRSRWGNDAPAVDPALVARLRLELEGQGSLQGGEGVRALAP